MPEHSPKMLETLVRHQFYSCVDWSKCSKVKMDVLEGEFVAVLEACIDSMASELEAKERQALINSVIDEVRTCDCHSKAEYARRLNPPSSLRERLGRFVNEKLAKLASPNLEFRADQMRDTTEAG